MDFFGVWIMSGWFSKGQTRALVLTIQNPEVFVHNGGCFVQFSNGLDNFWLPHCFSILLPNQWFDNQRQYTGSWTSRHAQIMERTGFTILSTIQLLSWKMDNALIQMVYRGGGIWIMDLVWYLGHWDLSKWLFEQQTTPVTLSYYSYKKYCASKRRTI